MQILKINQRNFKEIVRISKDFIKEGKIIVCPTDTVYGLLAAPANKKAVDKIFKIKRRARNKPLPIFIKDLKQAKELAEINKEQEKVLKKFWPGKMTAVLKRKPVKFELYGLNKKTIALRIPKYKLIIDLIKKTGCPLTGTSANISGKSASSRIKEVIRQLNDGPDLIINAGNLKKSKPSRIIDLSGKKIKILRK